jgi:hypothetical protein
VAPPDDDGLHSRSGEDLVAQIIPLRRRIAASEPPAERSPAGSRQEFPPASSPSERSIWDRPTADLPRRPARPPRGRERRARASRLRALPRWTLAVPAAIIVLTLPVVLVLSEGQPGGRSEPPTAAANMTRLLPPAVGGATQAARTARQPTSRTGGATRARLPSGGVPSQDRRAADQHRAPHRAGHVGEATHPASADVSQHSAVAPEASPTYSEADSTPVSAASPSPPAQAASPPAGSAAASAASQCVPGELGC